MVWGATRAPRLNRRRNQLRTIPLVLFRVKPERDICTYCRPQLHLQHTTDLQQCTILDHHDIMALNITLVRGTPPPTWP